MTLSKQLRELAGKATQDPLDDDGEYFSESGFEDLTKCGHGETGRYQNRRDGKLIASLWNNLPTILTALELQERLDKPDCVACEGKPAFLNDPCIICGRSSLKGGAA